MDGVSLVPLNKNGIGIRDMVGKGVISVLGKRITGLIILNYNVFLLAVILSLPIIELLDPETKSKNSNFLLI